MNMKEQIDTLVKLQKIETEAGKIKAELGQVSERLEKLDDELRDLEQVLKDEELYFDELKKKYRNYEADAQVNVSKVEKTKVKLRSVKTNKEYQALLKEIEDQETNNSEIEDQMLECLDRLDEVENSIAGKKKDYITLSDRIKSEKDRINQELQQQQQKLAELDANRAEVSSMVEPQLLEKYNLIKSQQRAGLAIAPVKNAVCYGCNLNLPPQMYNELHRRDALMFCPHCHRIVYWEAQPEISDR
jgi:hypothetical protein